MPPAVVAVGAALAASTVVGVVAAVAIGIATAIAAPALLKKLISIPDVADLAAGNQELNVSNSVPARMIVGEAVVSGNIIKYHKGEIDDDEYHHFFVPLCLHESEAVELYQLDGKNTTALTGEGYRIIPRDGTQTSALPEAVAEMPNVDNSFIGYGMTDAYCKFVIDPDIFPNGVQDVKFKVKGLKVYDPRKDSSVGGDGSHRLNTPRTWEWTDNAALINFHWKRFGGSIELPSTMFDLANISAEANICDELVDYLDGQGQTQQEKRYTCNGVVKLTESPEAVEDQLLSSCGGKWIEVGGKYWLRTAAYRGAPVVTITTDHIVNAPRRLPHVSLRERCNMVRCSFVSKHHYYQPTDMRPVKSDFLIAGRDGGKEFEHDLQLYCTNSDPMAQRLSVIYLEENAAGDTLELDVNGIGLQAAPGLNIRVDLPQFGIAQKVYEVQSCRFDPRKRSFKLSVKETTPAIYALGQTPALYDLTPNGDIDNTRINKVTDLTYTPAPDSPYRQGLLNWSHPTPNAVAYYKVEVYPAGEPTNIVFQRAESTSFEVNGLGLGRYVVGVKAVNRFGVHAAAETILIDVTVPTTLPGEPDVNIGNGSIVVTPPNLGNPQALYEWRYNTADNFATATHGGKDITITIPATLHGQTYWVWYRAVTNDGAGDWIKYRIDGAQGLTDRHLDPQVVELLEQINAIGLPDNIAARLDDLILDNLDQNQLLEAVQRELQQINIDNIAQLADLGQAELKQTTTEIIADKGRALAQDSLAAVATESENRSLALLELSATFDGKTAVINNQITAVASDVSAQASSINTMQVQVGNINANYASRSYVSATVDGAESGIINTIDSRFDQNTGVYGLQIKTAVDAANAAASKAEQLAVQIYDADGNLSQAFIDQVGLVTVDVDGASLAAAISSYTVSAGGNTYTLEQVAQASIDAGGNNFAAQWGVKSSLNGIKHGVGFHVDNGKTYFVASVNNFAIYDPATGSQDTIPFYISGGKTYIQEAAIESLSASKIVGDVTDILPAPINTVHYSGTNTTHHGFMVWDIQIDPQPFDRMISISPLPIRWRDLPNLYYWVAEVQGMDEVFDPAYEHYYENGDTPSIVVRPLPANQSIRLRGIVSTFSPTGGATVRGNIAISTFKQGHGMTYLHLAG